MWYLVTTLTNSEAHEYQRKPSSIKQARRIRTEIQDLTAEIRQNNPPLPGQQIISAGYIYHHQETLIREGQCLMYPVISAAANSVAQQPLATCKKQDHGSLNAAPIT